VIAVPDDVEGCIRTELAQWRTARSSSCNSADKWSDWMVLTNHDLDAVATGVAGSKRIIDDEPCLAIAVDDRAGMPYSSPLQRTKPAQIDGASPLISVSVGRVGARG
jgi:hypothetical protein